MTAWTAFGASDIGCVRARNEDAFAVADDLGLYLVADGMGGHAGGAVASRLARDGVVDYLRRANRASIPVGDLLARAVAAANAAVRARAAREPDLAGMGTTLTALWLPPGSAGGIVAHVGDSRVYGLGDDGVLAQLSDDHSVAMERVRAGAISLAQARRSAGWNWLTRAVGIDEWIAADVFPVAGQRAFLLCSDGLTGMVDDIEIGRLLRHHADDPRAAREALIEAAITAGGDDNVTVIVVHDRGSPLPRPNSRP